MQYIVVVNGIRIIGIIMKGNGVALSDDEIFPLTDSFVLFIRLILRYPSCTSSTSYFESK